MLRDPLDELIEDLEKAPPPVTAHSPESFAELIRYTDIMLYGSEEAKRRLDRDAKFQQFAARMRAQRASDQSAVWTCQVWTTDDHGTLGHAQISLTARTDPLVG
jgi:hypothetical protein